MHVQKVLKTWLSLPQCTSTRLKDKAYSELRCFLFIMVTKDANDLLCIGLHSEEISSPDNINEMGQEKKTKFCMLISTDYLFSNPF